MTKLLTRAEVAARVNCAMLIGCLLGAAMFLAAALLAEKNALYLPAIVLLAAAVAGLVA